MERKFYLNAEFYISSHDRSGSVHPKHAMHTDDISKEVEDEFIRVVSEKIRLAFAYARDAEFVHAESHVDDEDPEDDEAEDLGSVIGEDSARDTL